MDDNLNFFDDYYNLFCKVDKQAKNLNTDNLDIALKAASKCIGFDINPVRKEDMAKKLAEDLNKYLDAFCKSYDIEKPNIEVEMKDNLETIMTIKHGKKSK